MKNQVIKVLNKEHGKKVIEYWKTLGINTYFYEGDVSIEKNGNSGRIYYGIIEGCFSNYSKDDIDLFNAEIIQLPEEKTFPRVMLVGFDSDKLLFKRVVFAFKNGVYIAWSFAETIEEAEKINGLSCWPFAKEIDEPKTVELTIDQLLEKTKEIKKVFGLGEDDKLIIKI